MNDRIIYFDNAATTFPKPQGVLDAFYDCATNWCGNAGRGSHPIAMRSAEAIYSARESLASLFGASAENVAFSLNTTYALNLAIKGTMRRGGHMLISDLEHNSTLRPVAQLMRERKISYDVFPTHKDGVPYFDYVREIAKNPIAKAVKIADLKHNSDLTRFDTAPDEYAMKRQEKYLTALKILSEEI
jgi:selenocysteine lyase/cysteine desulfurase